MNILTIITMVIPFLIIISSILFIFAITKGRINYCWNSQIKILYWCMPLISYIVLCVLSFIYAQNSEDLENGMLGLILMISMSIITPLGLYGGMLYVEYSKKDNKQRILWITPLCIFLFYMLILILARLNRPHAFRTRDFYDLCEISSILLYVNCTIICPVIALMSARQKMITNKRAIR